KPSVVGQESLSFQNLYLGISSQSDHRPRRSLIKSGTFFKNGRNPLPQAFDLAIVGGGLGGSALARGMAERGAKILVLERETQFRDRRARRIPDPVGSGGSQEAGDFRSALREGRAKDSLGGLLCCEYSYRAPRRCRHYSPSM